MLKDVTLSFFEPLVGEGFEVRPAGMLPLQIVLFQASAIKVFEYPERCRTPFQLRFRGPLDRFLEQQTYSLSHAAIGSRDIFLVPIGREPDGFVYQAVFN